MQDSKLAQRRRRPRVDPDEGGARRIARQLHEQILALSEGAFLGSEDDLLAVLGVSRPTLRQAARILESEQLLAVKRGIGGGYYGRRPDAVTVARSAAVYLRLQGTTLADLLLASRSAGAMLAQLAAGSKDETAQANLKRSIEHMMSLRVPECGVADFVRAEVFLFEAICLLARNAPLELFMTTLYEFGLRESGSKVFEIDPVRIKLFRDARVEIGKAILAGDGEVAALMSVRASKLFSSWLNIGERL